ncbi:hypothetical protein ACQCWD_07580 [Bacillus thuringiensis]|uniref:Uncharacterized protein n=1 Tax=Bacillus cereus TaxID=1396 RepID=A0AAN5XP64_BACCE|nr:hypothetical protein [Bacillus cereus]KAB2448996.1 hypothetical protein F8165_16750 [Bacillus cereus]KAB2482341.1 hypothetical protein F8157_26700 [Bacillus cereus]
MFNNPNCNIVSSFTRNNKLYLTLELDFKNINAQNFEHTLGIDIGKFRIETHKNDDKLTISLYYDDIHLYDWDIKIPENTCITLEDQTFKFLGFGVKFKNINICLNTDMHVCLKAEVYLVTPLGDKYIDDINICS